MTEYLNYNAKFQQLFAYFSHDFKLVMSLVQSPRKAKIWAKKQGKEEGIVRGYLAQFMRYLRLRKSFVMSHPKKFEVANKILDYRKDKKCILFTSTVKDAETFKKRALVLHSKKKKKENKIILDTFNQLEIANIVSPQALDAGVDVKGLSVGIALTCNSSQVTDTQRVGRVCRFEEGKTAEFFTLVIANSVEETWYNNANKNQSYITINESQLYDILQGREISTRPKKGVTDFENRF
jgi:superfamily II DNA or RNA helicase